MFGFSIAGDLTAILVSDDGPIVAHPDPIVAGKLIDHLEKGDREASKTLLDPREKACDLIEGLSYSRFGASYNGTPVYEATRELIRRVVKPEPNSPARRSGG